MGILGSFLLGKEDIYADGELCHGDPFSFHGFSHGSSTSVIVLGYREGQEEPGLNMRVLSWGSICLACLDGACQFYVC